MSDYGINEGEEYLWVCKNTKLKTGDKFAKIKVQCKSRKKIPKYFDAKEGTQIQTSIREFGVKEGLTNDELDSMIDARSVNILYKAMLYDQLLNTKISSKKSKVVPKVTKPGTPATRGEISSDKVKAQRARLRKTGNVKDASSLLESILKS